ncbi:RNA polymerase sigma factor [Bernardetia sp. OM2101]|uniref:RNA polymerase sigma factor n=1 Tax=Bernardetia sp. OM2101 TaxID=3344876 RepID=UPI0035CEC300
MTNQEIFDHINNRNPQPVLKYFLSFSDSFYFFCKKQDKFKILSKHQIQAIFDDACICMYDKIEAKQITIRQMTSTVKTMIFGIGKNMAFEERRDETKYHSLHSFLEDSLNEISDFEDNNDDDFLKELQMQHLDEALSNLSDRHHALIVEGVMEGKSNSEIAKEQGYNSANAVSVEKLRVFKILKKSILEIQRRDEDWGR